MEDIIKKIESWEDTEAMQYIAENDTTSVKRCNRCNQPVLRSQTDGYSYQCMNCDEDLYEFEVHDGECYTPDEYLELLKNTKNVLALDE